MQAFQYASPTTVQEALDHLSSTWGEVDILAGGTDLLSLMKERIHTPKKVVGLRGIKELHGISKAGGGCASAPWSPCRSCWTTSRSRRSIRRWLRPRKASAVRRCGRWVRSSATCCSGRAAGISAAASGLLGKDSSGKALIPQR